MDLRRICWVQQSSAVKAAFDQQPKRLALEFHDAAVHAHLR
jgi:hypothetical protein